MWGQAGITCKALGQTKAGKSPKRKHPFFCAPPWVNLLAARLDSRPLGLQDRPKRWGADKPVPQGNAKFLESQC
ncbi:MAG: hypothetical protein A2600_09200 [Candidatus Lambdaproteobacteria bacterium RIFOXYD1_FULL_56_27]|uniref:Uncharacterized protein n=1 Tax=Candidatus Lambdaproteobacteria bacterium RIFOXYD2_FULL_56_26 TaxID=1817773 RepID=A0A1F6GLE1_9PROT|nr:MAG: hypothetical protein A2557_13325 [Candidatus Lambdaproteobacteria bacterium RIFOXYD2_FULL_56_26]OGH03594.1 MAG: hypothetical protein A2426_06515 [Candidatus Lambdaproteobacteria bacterium RIFOXYC1_FULL_56_13]OGH08731.1 MAG: hypothetical protein A2600_09200 [Candidatus Lambdaproteobacteria bacterium RIFOXYD1_FULL_56_27]